MGVVVYEEFERNRFSFSSESQSLKLRALSTVKGEPQGARSLRMNHLLWLHSVAPVPPPPLGKVKLKGDSDAKSLPVAVG